VASFYPYVSILVLMDSRIKICFWNEEYNSIVPVSILVLMDSRIKIQKAGYYDLVTELVSILVLMDSRIKICNATARRAIATMFQSLF